MRNFGDWQRPFDGQPISWWEQDWTSEHGFGNAEEEEKL